MRGGSIMSISRPTRARSIISPCCSTPSPWRGPSIPIAASSDLQSMEELVAHAAGQVTDDLPPAIEARLQDLAGRFDAAVDGMAPVPLTCVIFHLTLPPDARRIDYVDIQADQGKIDYIAVLQHAFAMARTFNPDCRILYITGEADDADFVPADVTVVRLPLEPRHLMYERVVAISAYVQSRAFAPDTAFLDSDALDRRAHV